MAAAPLVADPGWPFHFAVRTPTSASMGLPDGSTVAVPLLSRNADFGISRDFPTKLALDAAFPNGTYRLSGDGIPAMAFNLATDAYPSTVPTVANTGWTRGILVLDARQTNAIRINSFTGYASGGLIGYVQIRVQDLTNNLFVYDQVVSAVNSVGIATQPTPVTLLIIGAGSLRGSRLYRGQATFANVTTLDQSAVPQAAAVATFSRTTTFYLAMTTGGVAPAETFITAQPANQFGVVGDTVTFPLAVNLPPAFGEFVQWNFNGQPINLDNNKYSSSDGQSLTVRNLSAADVGSYSATIVAAGGIVTSADASLTIIPAAAPLITRQPVSQHMTSGSTVVFTAAATAVPAPTFQWRKDNVDLQGQTATMLLLQNVGPVSAGDYSVVIANSAGSVTSASATLAVSSSSNNPGRLINLSIFTPLSVGETMTMGTVLGGGGTSGTKPLLARAAGPSLAQLNVTGFLPDPKVTLNYTTPSPTVLIATNDDWSGTAALSTAFAQVGAFAYAATNSKDAAIFQSGASALQPGNYTVQVSDAGTGSGTVIAELYDATPPAGFANATPRLINVSVLKSIAAGASLTAGFYVGGATSKTVLIRAIGPTLGLAPFNVGGAMPDPQLTLFNSSQAVIASNNDWGGDPALSNTASRVGGFSISNGASKDAMLLITLAPGSYTANVSPLSGTAGGTVIVEVYEVP